MASSSSALADPAMLSKIDKLFACNVGHYIDLPQIVVVGDQSSGKSSALEGLTGLPFPRDSGLCTRFATQITFRRSLEKQISVSIIPGRNSTPEHADKVRSWSKANLPDLKQTVFATIMREVQSVMGLSENAGASGTPKTFSEDVLCIEVCGPDQEHLSVIDVPGIFKRTTQGVTTKDDMKMVEEMVLGYMKNPRSVMLTVIPANVDIATQAILEMAEEVDPEGRRTLGVLTKPDLVDRGAEKTVVEMIEGRVHHLSLGWCLVRNPGQMEASDPNVDRNVIEERFFAKVYPWSGLAKDRVGVVALRERLQEILAAHIRHEFPKVKAELNKKLKNCRKLLSGLGPKRDTSAAQSSFLIEMATRFQAVAGLAIEAKYWGDDLFTQKPSLKIATAVVSRNEVFANAFQQYGHTYQFKADPDEESDDEESKDNKVKIQRSTRTTTNHQTIDDIMHDNEKLPEPNVDGILDWLTDIYRTSRGFELGTFDPALLATTMKAQSSNWNGLAFGYVSDIATITHGFIEDLLELVCPDGRLRENLMSKLMDHLLGRYKRAFDQAGFILQVERFGVPATLDSHFNDNLENCRQERMKKDVHEMSFSDGEGQPLVKLEDIIKSHPMNNAEYVVQDLHDILKSYYTVACKRIVDTLSMQAAAYHLVCGPQTPLKIFSPSFVGQLSAEQLDEIAGEDALLKRKRAQLQKELEDLEIGRKILS